MLDYLFVAGGALSATLLIYGGWLCSHHLADSLLDFAGTSITALPDARPQAREA
jgi:hypothetical protein